MKNILVIGAGRSTTALINYVLQKAAENQWFVTVADANPSLAEQKVGNHKNGRATWLDVTKANDRREIIGRNDIVVSLLPAHLHFLVAKDCIKYRKHLVTASYVSREMYKLGDEVEKADLIFMGEMGLDPGIDHMSAMEIIDNLKNAGAKIHTFRSYAGGLMAPESDDNPWKYKFTWNPRNVVLAGQGTAQYLEDKSFKYIPYSRLFSGFHLVDVPGMGEYEAYANRDSLLYREIYGLKEIPNILRATLRKRGYCEAWDAFVQLGLTDDSYPIIGSKDLTYHDLVEAYLPKGKGNESIQERLANFLEIAVDDDVIDKLQWLGLFEHDIIGLDKASPAKILQHLLEQKWKLKPSDKDMIIMQHEFEYTLDGTRQKHTSTMVLKGEDNINTAMAKLVGLPLGIFVKLIIEGKIKSKGVQIPVMEEVYTPVLEELKEYGVVFKHKVEDMA